MKNTYINYSKKNSGLVDSDKILNYTVHREKLAPKSKTRDFKDAVNQMDEYVSDRKVKLQLKNCFPL